MQIRKVLLGLTCVAALSWCGNLEVRPWAQQIGHTSVEVRVLQPPTPTVALGRTHLVYELHLTNFGSSPATLEQIDVLDGERAVLASWSGKQLWQRVRIVGRQPDGTAATADEIPPGQRAIVYLWLTLPPGANPAAGLAHRVTCANGANRETLTTATLLLPAPALPIAPPVRAGPWVAVRAPSNASGHRLSFVAMEGRARVPQRFAVDWVLLGDDGLPFHGDRTDVTNWYGYDVPVYAAAAGTVVLIRDGRPDLAAFGPAPAVMDAADAPGNIVVLEIGPGRFATYAHLKAGSLSVTRGDRVVAGQLLARIGNSGNTLGPHLHFHVSDAPEPLGGEGLPFALRSFELTGRIASMPQLLAGTAWTPAAAQPARTVTGEMPLENMVIRFGSD